MKHKRALSRAVVERYVISSLESVQRALNGVLDTAPMNSSQGLSDRKGFGGTAVSDMNTPAADRATGDGSADEAQGDFTRSPHGGSEDEERGAVEVQGEGQAADGAATGIRKRRLLRARKTAEELNLLRDPTEKIVELTEPILQELAGAKKLHQLRYPTYVVCTHPNFQLRSIEGLVSIKGTALKELNLSDNKLMVLDSLDQFSTLKILKASRNEIFEVVIEKLPRLKVLDLSHNRLQGIPDLSGFKTLAHLDLSHNLIGTRPESETSPDGWENFKNSPLQQLTRLDLSYNQMNWDQKTFNDQVVTLKEKSLRHLAFVGNPFVEEVEGYRIWILSNCPKIMHACKCSPQRPLPSPHRYRIWILSNCPKIIDVDGEKMSVLERRSRIKDPPAVVKEVKAENTLDEYLGKRVVVKLFEQTKQLMECFDAPDRTLDAVAKVQDKLLQRLACKCSPRRPRLPTGARQAAPADPARPARARDVRLREGRHARRARAPRG